MLNIETQVCGLIVILLLIFFSTRHERIGLYSEHIFHLSLFINLVCILLDILSVVMIVYSEIFPEAATKLVCRVYLVALATVAYMGLVYCYTDVKKLRENKLLIRFWVVVEIVGDMLIMTLPIHCYHEGRAVYTYGPSDIATYCVCFFLFLNTLVISLIYGKYTNPHRTRAVRAWMLFNLFGAFIQFLNPQILLVGFGCSIGMMILYAELENPDWILDRVTGTFNFSALREYVKQLYDNNQNFAAVIVCMDDEWRLEHELEDKILLSIADYFRGIEGVKLFRGEGKDFFLIYRENPVNNYAIMSRVDMEGIVRRFKKPWEEGIIIGMTIMYIPDGKIASNSDELISIYQYNKAELDESTGEQIVLNSDSIDGIKEYKEVLHEIIRAVDEDKIEVFYQPIYSFEEDRFISAEALCRIRDSRGEIMMPDRFIPVAEESGMIRQIGERVFENSCLFLKDERLKEYGTRYFEVNLSVVQCEKAGFAYRYAEIIKEHDLPPGSINLEITESSAMNLRNVLIENINYLKGEGLNFSLDDFGTGESNLNYIVDMPVDIVKFDRSMVSKFFVNERARIVMTESVKMIKELGYKIVAEGVETYDQLLAMKELGIDFIQGFYFSKPLPQDEYIEFIKTKNAAPVMGK